MQYSLKFTTYLEESYLVENLKSCHLRNGSKKTRLLSPENRRLQGKEELRGRKNMMVTLV